MSYCICVSLASLVANFPATDIKNLALAKFLLLLLLLLLVFVAVLFCFDLFLFISKVKLLQIAPLLL